MSVFAQDISIGSDLGGTPAALGASPGSGFGRSPSRGGALGSPIRSPGASNNIVPFKPVGRGGALGGPLKGPSVGSGTTLPGGGVNPASGQGRALPQLPSSIPFPRIPAGALPGNPFAPSPQPFQPSGADKLPEIKYPNQLPPEAIGPGPEFVPYEPPPFTGGQSPGISYIVSFQRRQFSGGVWGWSSTFTRTGSGPVNTRSFDRPDCTANSNGQIATAAYLTFNGVDSGTPLVNQCSDSAPGYKILSVNRTDSNPDTGGDLPPINPGETGPNPARPKTPQPLPSTPTPTPSRPEPQPWPQRERERDPAKQPLRPISPEPVPLRPSPNELPEELRPPAPKPDQPRVTDPAGNPITLPSGTPQGGSTATGAPSSTSAGLGQGVKIQPISIPVPTFSPVNPATTTAPVEVPVQITFGQPQPVVTPVTNYSTTTGTTPDIQFLPEPVFNQPPTKTGECTPDPEAKCRYDSKDIAGKCDKIQNLLDVNLDKNYSGKISLPPCEEGDPVEFNANAKGIPGIDEKLDAIAEALEEIWDRVKCPSDAVAAIPEWWQVRAGANRPQLVVLYAEQKPGGKLGQSRWALTLPWFKEDMRSQLATSLPSYNKGQWQGMKVLSDNSKIILYAASQVEAENTVNQLLVFIQPGMINGGDIYIGQRKGANLREVFVVPTIAHYYPTGQQNTAPAWSERLR